LIKYLPTQPKRNKKSLGKTKKKSKMTKLTGLLDLDNDKVIFFFMENFDQNLAYFALENCHFCKIWLFFQIQQ